MGNVVSFHPRKPKEIKPSHYDDFEKFYVDHHEVVNSLTDNIVLQLSYLVDIGEVHGYDKFMLRETIMSLIMRQKGIYHPMQEFTEEYVETFCDLKE
jgi:hypothetical protein